MCVFTWSESLPLKTWIHALEYHQTLILSFVKSTGIQERLGQVLAGCSVKSGWVVTRKLWVDPASPSLVPSFLTSLMPIAQPLACWDLEHPHSHSWGPPSKSCSHDEHIPARGRYDASIEYSGAASEDHHNEVVRRSVPLSRESQRVNLGGGYLSHESCITPLQEYRWRHKNCMFWSSQHGT